MSPQEIEQRIILMLRRNSRASIVDMARSLSISRITAKKAFDRVIADGRVRSFTISSREDEENLALVHLKPGSTIPEELLLEKFSLIDGTSLDLIYLEDLGELHDAGIIGVDIVKKRDHGKAPLRTRNLHCDYCHAEIRGIPISVTYDSREYFVCCPNCQKDMNRLLASVR